MTTRSVDDPAAAEDFLSGLEIEGRRASVDDEFLSAESPVFDDSEQAVAVGSQIAEFAKDVPAGLRAQISNSFLLAQLAANKAVKDGGKTKEWYDQYLEVLANVGWLVEASTVTEEDVSGASAEMHKAIIPILAVALGPAAAAATIVTAVLKGLSDMDKDSPWITLFERESQRASANSFQVSYADVVDGTTPRISLACFELDAERSVVQVLFFKFSDSSAKLRSFGTSLSINNQVFEQTKSVVDKKLAGYVSNYIAEIEI